MTSRNISGFWYKYLPTVIKTPKLHKCMYNSWSQNTDFLLRFGFVSLSHTYPSLYSDASQVILWVWGCPILWTLSGYQVKKYLLVSKEPKSSIIFLCNYNFFDVIIYPYFYVHTFMYFPSLTVLHLKKLKSTHLLKIFTLGIILYSVLFPTTIFSLSE